MRKGTDTKKGASARTANSYLQSCKQFGNWMVRDDRAESNPLIHLQPCKAAGEKCVRRRALTIEECRRLIIATEKAGDSYGLTGVERAMLYRVALGTGFRASEIRSLRLPNFNLDDKYPTITVEAGYSKNGTRRDQPIAGRLAADLAVFLADRDPEARVFEINADRTARMLRGDLAKAGIDAEDSAGNRVDFHALRHTYITLGAKAGIAPKVLMDLARHSDINLTMKVYSHTIVADRARALEAVPDITGGDGHESAALRATGTCDDGPGVVPFPTSSDKQNDKRVGESSQVVIPQSTSDSGQRIWSQQMPRSTIICILLSISIGLVSLIFSCQAPRSVAADPSPTTRPAPSGRTVYLPAQTLCEISNEAIDESSGLAHGHVNKGVLWTHNDSGDSPRIFAMNHAGADLATVNITGLAARDWEDMCSFSIGGKAFLMIADIGDNAVVRRSCRLHVLAEPKLDTAKRGRKLSVAPLMTISFRYEDGAHNCESVAVDATTKTIYLVSKRKQAICKVYAIGLPNKTPKKPLVARTVGALRIPTTTAMDISPDGLTAVVLSYENAYEYVRRSDETWTHGFSRGPRVLEMPFRTQGESICYGPDGRTLYLTSENLPVPLLRVPAKAPTTKPAAK